MSNRSDGRLCAAVIQDAGRDAHVRGDACVCLLHSRERTRRGVSIALSDMACALQTDVGAAGAREDVRGDASEGRGSGGSGLDLAYGVHSTRGAAGAGRVAGVRIYGEPGRRIQRRRRAGGGRTTGRRAAGRQRAGGRAGGRA